MKTDKTKQPTTLQAIENEIAKVKKQLGIVKMTKDTLDKRLNELLHERERIQVDKLVGLKFISNTDNKCYQVIKLNITSTNHELVYYANVRKDGSTGAHEFVKTKALFLEYLKNEYYKKV